MFDSLIDNSRQIQSSSKISACSVVLQILVKSRPIDYDAVSFNVLFQLISGP